MYFAIENLGYRHFWKYQYFRKRKYVDPLSPEIDASDSDLKSLIELAELFE
jgi:hypothetical protein